MLGRGNAGLLAGLLGFLERRAHHCLTPPGCIELYRVWKQMRLPSPCPRVGVLPSVVSVVCACTVSGVASSQDGGTERCSGKLFLTPCDSPFRK